MDLGARGTLALQEEAAWLQCYHDTVPCHPSRASLGSPEALSWMWLFQRGCGVSICIPYLNNAFSLASPAFSPCWKPSAGVAGRCFTFPETSLLSLASVFFQQKPPASLLLPSRKKLPRETAFTADHSANHFYDGFPSAIKPSCSPCTT